MRALARIYPGPVSNETPYNGGAPSHPREAPLPGDRLIRFGVIVFAIGAVATLVTVAPLFLGADPLPSVAYFVCMLMGVGFALAAVGLLRSIAAQRREASAPAQVSPPSVPPSG
ncbi:membrane protein [Streptomyces malaysiensis]|uniref:Membrane protein n=1 Tax=Streptomyces malaysiensis TaxID=92644 RepID=A0A7X5X455_STRMQ|nr:membrane protein [Streptomyces malaysiensis]